MSSGEVVEVVAERYGELGAFLRDRSGELVVGLRCQGLGEVEASALVGASLVASGLALLVRSGLPLQVARAVCESCGMGGSLDR